MLFLMPNRVKAVKANIIENNSDIFKHYTDMTSDGTFVFSLVPVSWSDLFV